MEAVEQALADLRVIDLSQGIAGPYCTKWFTDFGARVTKVEPPGGDASRAVGPFPGDEPHPEKSALFLYLNTGKRSITLDIDRAEGQAVLRRLIAEADVLVDDSPPGTMAQRGLAYDDLKDENPELVYVAISSFGQTGPDRDTAATDLTLAARSGTMVTRRFAGRPPIKMGGSQSLYMGGRSAFLSAMAAVLHRDVTGRGQLVDVSLLEATAINDLAWPTTYSYQGLARQPSGPPASRGRGGMGPYPCKDGSVDVLPGVGGLKKLAVMLGDPKLAEHEWFRNHRERGMHAKEFDEQFMDPWFSERTREEVVEAAQAAGMPFSCQVKTDEVEDDPQLVEREFFATIDHPEAGPLSYPTSSVRFDAERFVPGRAPLLGEHTEMILREELGYDAAELEKLRSEEVV